MLDPISLKKILLCTQFIILTAQILFLYLWKKTELKIAVAIIATAIIWFIAGIIWML